MTDNPKPNHNNTFDPEKLPDRVGLFWNGAKLANAERKPFLVWNDRVYVTSELVMYDTGYQRKDL